MPGNYLCWGAGKEGKLKIQEAAKIVGKSRPAILHHIAKGNIRPTIVEQKGSRRPYYDLSDADINYLLAVKRGAKKGSRKTGRPKKARVGHAYALSLLKAAGCMQITCWVDEKGRHLGGTPQEAVETLRKEE